MSRFEFKDLPLQGLKIIRRKNIEDTRGFFSKLFSAKEFEVLKSDQSIQQINHTFTRKKATIRGLHFQIPPHSENKIISCLRGSVWDVAVDLRQDSPTFLKWHAQVLTGDDQSSFFIPKGFAHGFQTLEENCELLYFHSSEYFPDSDKNFAWNDDRISIQWPLSLSDISERDRTAPHIGQDYKGIKL